MIVFKNSKNLKVSDILELTNKNCSGDEYFFISTSSSLDTIIKKGKEGTKDFQPVENFHENSKTHLCFDYSFGETNNGFLTLNDFRKFIKEKEINMNAEIEHDIEDGYVFSELEIMVVFDNFIVFS